MLKWHHFNFKSRTKLEINELYKIQIQIIQNLEIKRFRMPGAECVGEEAGSQVEDIEDIMGGDEIEPRER